MTAAEILRKARQVIETPDRWIKGNYRRTEGDKTCFCLLGAMNYAREVSGNSYSDASCKAINAVRYQVQQRRGGSNIPAFNDTPETTHADVLAVLDEAIAATGDL